MYKVHEQIMILVWKHNYSFIIKYYYFENGSGIVGNTEVSF